MVTASRRATLRQNHSIWSAKMLGVAISTVAGRLRIVLRCGVGCQTAVTASQISTAKSSSVPVKLSGEYWNVHCVPLCCAAQSRISAAARTAMSTIPALSRRKTTRRCVVDVEL